MANVDRWLFWITFVVAVTAFGWFFADSMMVLHDSLAHIRGDVNSQSAILLQNAGELDDKAARLSFLAKGRVALEHDAMFNRQRRTNAALENRTWFRFMTLTFGTLMVVIGTVFILGRVTAPVFEGGLNWENLKISVLSSSPGLILAMLGCLLVTLPTVAQQKIKAKEPSTYMQHAEDVVPVQSTGIEVPEIPEGLAEDLKRVRP